MICTYCQRRSINDPMYLVRQAVKPKGAPHRWLDVGHCCDDCEADGHPTELEYPAQAVQQVAA